MLYFAYGSNLWLQQMAQRCPYSCFIGRAVLLEHRWQINQRGFANVVPHSGSSVHGLVYDVDKPDETRLDRSEGVHSGAYSKAYCNVVLYPATPDLQKHPGRVSHALNAYRQGAQPFEQLPIMEEHVLVYLSTNYINDDQPREEYIHRINAGIQDAVALGVPPAFFENVVRPVVPAEPGASDHPHSAVRFATRIFSKFPLDHGRKDRSSQPNTTTSVAQTHRSNSQRAESPRDARKLH